MLREVKEKLFLCGIAIMTALTVLPLFHIIYSVAAKGLPVLLIRFGDAIIMDRGFYAYKNYLIGIRYGVVPLIIPREKFRLEKLKGMISYPLTVFNSKNVEKEKKRYRKLIKRLFEGLKLNLKSLRSIIEDVIKLGKEVFSLRQLHCYSFESVKKWCSTSVLLQG